MAVCQQAIHAGNRIYRPPQHKEDNSSLQHSYRLTETMVCSERHNDGGLSGHGIENRVQGRHIYSGQRNVRKDNP